MPIVFEHPLGWYLLWVYTWGVFRVAAEPPSRERLQALCTSFAVGCFIGLVPFQLPVIWMMHTGNAVPAVTITNVTAFEVARLAVLAYCILIHTHAAKAFIHQPFGPSALAASLWRPLAVPLCALERVVYNYAYGAMKGAFAPLEFGPPEQHSAEQHLAEQHPKNA